MTDSNLGPVKAFQIREFPEALRKAIVAEAADRNITVSEFLTSQLAKLHAAGWDRGPTQSTSLTTFANPENQPLTEDQKTARVQALAALAHANALMRQAGGRTQGRRFIAQEFEALIQPQPALAPRVKRLSPNEPPPPIPIGAVPRRKIAIPEPQGVAEPAVRSGLPDAAQL